MNIADFMAIFIVVYVGVAIYFLADKYGTMGLIDEMTETPGNCEEDEEYDEFQKGVINWIKWETRNTNPRWPIVNLIYFFLLMMVSIMFMSIPVPHTQSTLPGLDTPGLTPSNPTGPPIPVPMIQVLNSVGTILFISVPAYYVVRFIYWKYKFGGEEDS